MPQRNPDVPPPFDQGVFLMHYNRGREAFQEGRYAEARKELETAQRFRPDDADVLNLLGLVYFKTNAFPEAEVIYRRLAAENPAVFILHSNLGLILFKRGNLDEAERHLLKAVELRPNYSKSHLYLGLLYKQRKKYGLALEHLKFAGAEKAAREVETEMRAGSSRPQPQPPVVPPESKTAPVPAMQPVPVTPPPRPAPVAPAPAPPPPVEKKIAPPAVTSRVRIPDFEDLPPTLSTQPGRVATPEITQAHRIPPHSSTSGEDTLSMPKNTLSVSTAAARKLQDAVDETSMAEEKRLDLGRRIEGASKTFTLHENGFLEIDFRKSVHVKRGTVSSYSGNLKFVAESGLVGTTAQMLVRAVGHGKINVYEKGRKAFLLDLTDEFIYVEGGNLLALEDSLSYRVEPIYDTSYQRKIDTVKIFGKGSLAISTSIEPLTLRVTREYPLSISSNALVAWTGNLIASVIEDHALAGVMIEASSQSFKIRFEGDGVVVSEQ